MCHGYIIISSNIMVWYYTKKGIDRPYIPSSTQMRSMVLEYNYLHDWALGHVWGKYRQFIPYMEHLGKFSFPWDWHGFLTITCGRCFNDCRSDTIHWSAFICTAGVVKIMWFGVEASYMFLGGYVCLHETVALPVAFLQLGIDHSLSLYCSIVAVFKTPI